MRRRSHRVLASVLLSLTATAATGESNAQPRAPVPQGAALEASQKAAADLYGDRFQSAKTLADKTAVTADMIEAALQLQDGSADQYACRAGTTARSSFGDDAGILGQHAWWAKNSGGRTQPVGQLRPNALGLFDMHGNVWEWCADWHAGDYYAKSPIEDPTGPDSGSSRVLRGGSWRTAFEDYSEGRTATSGPPEERSSAWGFRVARTLTP